MDNLIQILQIPDRCLVNKKITKAFFKRNFELTFAEKKFLDDFNNVNQIDWLASVKPENSNIIAFAQDQSVYEEVVIISVQTGEDEFDKNKQKIAELIQKYIPYNILLCIYNSSNFILNTCEKRLNQNDSTKRTIVRKYFTENISFTVQSENQKLFIKSLAFSELDKQNLKTFHDSFITRIIALQAAEITSIYTVRKNERSFQDVQCLGKITQLRSEILTLQNQAKKETQLNVQIKLNTTIQKKRIEIKLLVNLITR